jgi:hypothetical protein
MFTAASNAIQTGPTDDEEINKRDLTAISRMLKDAGYISFDGLEADNIAKQLYENSDLPTFMKYLNKYLDNDSKRDAYNKASQAFKRLNLVSAQLQSHYLTKRELPLLIEQFKTAKRADPTLTSSEFLQAGGGIKGAPITDKTARAALGKIELADEKKKWFMGTDVQRNEEGNFKTQLTTLTQDVWAGAKAGEIDNKVAPFATPFLNRYDTLVREASERLTDLSPEERDEAMNKAVTEIKTDLLGRWTRLQQTQKAVEDQKLQEIEDVVLVDNEELEDAERDVQNLLSYWETFTIKQGLNLARFISDDEIPDPFLTIGEQDYETSEKSGAVSPVRSRALNAVEGYEEALKDSNKLIEKYDDADAPRLYKVLVTKLRERFGYRSIDEVPDYDPNADVDPVDYRVTPVVGRVEDLGKTLIKWRDEAKVFTALPLEKQNIEDPEFSTLKKMRDKFGVGISAAQITAFRDAQLKLFNTR